MSLLKILLATATIALVGCSGTMPVQAGGSIEKHNGTKVEAVATQVNFLGFTPMSLATADGATAQLQSKCSSGKVTGITSMVRHTFFFIVVKEDFEISGYCAD